jgi:hypothetical protein
VVDRSNGDRPSNAQRSEWRAAREQQRDAARVESGPQASVAPPMRREWRQDRGPSAGTGAAAPVTQGGWAAPRDGSYGARSRGDYGANDRRDPRNDARGEWRQGDGSGTRTGGRDQRDGYRQGYRDGRREDWRDDRRDTRDAYNRGYRAGDRSDDARSGHWNGRDGRWDGRSDHRRWDRRAWRNDRRYDWYRYRALNRSIFSPGRYYAPYRDYRYSGISIGIRLGSPFYSSRYWINDPWRYRLPPAYGPYRWVRYYDDAVLVDIYSGEVVDVIRNFFW